MKTRVTASIDVIDAQLWKKQVGEFMNKLFKKAGIEFLNKAMPLIPVWTGHAGSAFKNLGEAVDKNISVSTRGVRFVKTRSGARRLRILRNEYYYPPGGGRIKKTNQSGQPFASAKDDIINTRGVSLASGRLAFYFKFEIDIIYFSLLDRDRWHSFERGTKVFQDYIESHLVDIPNITNALVRKKVV